MVFVFGGEVPVDLLPFVAQLLGDDRHGLSLVSFLEAAHTSRSGRRFKVLQFAGRVEFAHRLGTDLSRTCLILDVAILPEFLVFHLLDQRYPRFGLAHALGHNNDAFLIVLSIERVPFSVFGLRIHRVVRRLPISFVIFLIIDGLEPHFVLLEIVVLGKFVELAHCVPIGHLDALQHFFHLVLELVEIYRTFIAAIFVLVTDFPILFRIPSILFMILTKIGIGIPVYGHPIALFKISLFSVLDILFLTFLLLRLWPLGFLSSEGGFRAFVIVKASLPEGSAHGQRPLAHLTRGSCVSLFRTIELNQVFLTQGRFRISILRTMFSQVVLNNSLVILHLLYALLKYLHFVVKLCCGSTSNPQI